MPVPKAAGLSRLRRGLQTTRVHFARDRVERLRRTITTVPIVNDHCSTLRRSGIRGWLRM